MVKNEAPSMEKTLQSLVEGGITSYFIFDTGSIDKTIKVTEEFFEKNNITDFRIMQEPFVDFSTSRNRALELTEEQFPDGGFMLMLDAEWHLCNVPGLIEFCRNQVDKTTGSYLVRILGGDDFYAGRLIRCKSGVRFAGDPHEAVYASERVPSTIYFELHMTAYGIEKSRQRWHRDKEKLMESHRQDPLHTRTLFYLAQTFHCLGELREAYYYYKKRSQLIGCEEEDYIAIYRLAIMTEELSKVDPDYTWEEAQNLYLNAYAKRPTRAEPLIRLAQHYWDARNLPLCYLFAKRASVISYPDTDNLFIEKYLYDYLRWDLLSMIAWHFDDYESGEIAARKVVQLHPEYIHLHRNLSFYVGHKEKNESEREKLCVA